MLPIGPTADLVESALDARQDGSHLLGRSLEGELSLLLEGAEYRQGFL
jgi:hypothetical protein